MNNTRRQANPNPNPDLQLNPLPNPYPVPNKVISLNFHPLLPFSLPKDGVDYCLDRAIMYTIELIRLTHDGPIKNPLWFDL